MNRTVWYVSSFILFIAIGVSLGWVLAGVTSQAEEDKIYKVVLNEHQTTQLVLAIRTCFVRNQIPAGVEIELRPGPTHGQVFCKDIPHAPTP